MALKEEKDETRGDQENKLEFIESNHARQALKRQNLDFAGPLEPGMDLE